MHESYQIQSVWSCRNLKKANIESILERDCIAVIGQSTKCPPGFYWQNGILLKSQHSFCNYSNFPFYLIYILYDTKTPPNFFG